MARLVSYKVRDENRYSTFGRDKTATATATIICNENYVNKKQGKNKSKNHTILSQSSTISLNRDSSINSNDNLIIDSQNQFNRINKPIKKRHKKDIKINRKKFNILSTIFHKKINHTNNINENNYRNQSSIINNHNLTRTCCHNQQNTRKLNLNINLFWTNIKLWCYRLCCCCYGTNMQNLNNPNSNYDRNNERNLCCNCYNGMLRCYRLSFCCFYCKCKICCNNDYSNYDDDDIDGKFEQYKYEMSLKETNFNNHDQQQQYGYKNSGITTSFPSSSTTYNNIEPSDILNSTIIKLDGKPIDIDTIINDSKILKNHKNDCIKISFGLENNNIYNKNNNKFNKKQKHIWNWDDSLRSNSDKFLETLEYDDNDNNDCDDNHKICDNKKFFNNRIQIIHKGREEATANAVVSTTNVVQSIEPPSSPAAVKHNVHGDSASPIQSHGSASSDPWPSQSDEDIDRLVALHQNRSSLSSLGLRSDSMASVYSGAGEGRYGTVVVKGQVEFGMQYNYKLSALEVHVVRCKDLAAVDSKRNRSDPYVKLYLLPDKSKGGKRKTKVKKHTLNPIFDEILRFHMPLSSLESRSLWLTVWHSDMFGRNDFLGEVTINLQGRVFDNPQSQWYLLQERSEPFDDLATYRGDIIVGLKFIPPDSASGLRNSLTRGSNSNLKKFGSIKSNTKNFSTKGQLHVLVKEAKNLSAVKPNGNCDAFCKSYLLPDRTRSSKQKTQVAKRSNNPVWNYTFVYEDVSLQELSERALELTIWDHDRLASNEFLGGVRFSLGTGKNYGKPVDWMDATGKELSLWQNMLNRPNFWVEGGLILRSSLDGIKALP